MDDEARGALEMTKDELKARWDAGKPANVRRPRDVNQRAAAIVAEATEWHSGIAVSPPADVHFEGNRSGIPVAEIALTVTP